MNVYIYQLAEINCSDGRTNAADEVLYVRHVKRVNAVCVFVCPSISLAFIFGTKDAPASLRAIDLDLHNRQCCQELHIRRRYRSIGIDQSASINRRSHRYVLVVLKQDTSNLFYRYG